MGHGRHGGALQGGHLGLCRARLSSQCFVSPKLSSIFNCSVFNLSRPCLGLVLRAHHCRRRGEVWRCRGLGGSAVRCSLNKCPVNRSSCHSDCHDIRTMGGRINTGRVLSPSSPSSLLLPAARTVVVLLSVGRLRASTTLPVSSSLARAPRHPRFVPPTFHVKHRHSPIPSGLLCLYHALCLS